MYILHVVLYSFIETSSLILFLAGLLFSRIQIKKRAAEIVKSIF